jgi:hypothetical protein
MPLVIDRTSEAPLSTLFDDEFIRSLTQYIGIEPDTPSEDMPLSITELLEEAISTCEQAQWRFILPKDVILLIPDSAFCPYDNMLILPLGVANNVIMTYKDVDGVDQPYTDFTQYAGEPIRLHSNNWSGMTSNCLDTMYPISVSYTPGYKSFDEIPKSTVRALKLMAAHSFEYRGSDIPFPQAYEHNMNLGWLNNERANRYIVDDWNRVAPR